MNNSKSWNIPTFIISIDTELAWGSFDHKNFESIKWKFEEERKIIDKILELLEKYNIPATWAIVGHLFLDKCRIANNRKHPEIKRPDYSWYKKDWFEKDPAATLESDPIWYGKDIVTRIKNAKPAQEIGCHSFSHIVFGDSGCSQEAADSDLSACVSIAQDNGLDFKSFIFPRNSVGHLFLLKKYGFTIYRGLDETWFYDIPQKKLQQIGHYIDEFLALSPRSVKVKETLSGLVNVPGSMLYMSKDGIRSFIPVKFRVKKGKKGIDRAIEKKEVFHFWFHPFNLVGKYENELLDGIEEILRYAVLRKEEGLLNIMTMQQIAKTYLFVA